MNLRLLRPGTTRRAAGAAVLALLGLSVLALGTGPAIAAPARAGAEDAVIRAAHFSPTTPGVDVYLTPFSGGPSKLWLAGVGYGAVSPYQDITAGLYTVAMRPHGAAASTKPVLSWTLNAQPGKAYTAAGVGSGASVKGVVIRDDLTAPPSGKGRVRVIQAASRAPKVTVSAENGPVIAKDASFAQTTSYATVPAGRWPLRAVAVGTNGVQTSGDVTVAAGSVTSVLLLDAKSTGITLRTVLDSSAARTMPRGSVPAGGGGMAAVIAGRDESAGSGGIRTGALAGLLTLIAAVSLVLGTARGRRFVRPTDHGRT